MFQSADAALIRAASDPQDLRLPAWPDLTADRPEEWLEWLREAWALPGFPAAVTPAAPHLAAQITRALAREPMAIHRLRHVAEATVRYLLRWTTRATPFGRFAGVAPVEVGPRAVVRWRERHHEATRPDDRFIAEYPAVAERDLETLRTVAVVTNALGYRRGGVWVLPCARVEGDRVWDVEIDLTGPVRVAVETASAVHLARHIAFPAPGGRLVVDLRVDCSVTLPPAVVLEAAEAASALVAVAPHLPGWAAYRRAFIERWGPGAAVPLRDVLRGLGFPAGYRGSPRRDPAAFTARDSLLTSLAQQSALDGCAEVVLNDDLIASLRGDDDRPPVTHTEFRFTLAAATPQDLDRGAFTKPPQGPRR